MTTSAVESALGAHNVPDSVLALSSLPDIDYADLFTLDAGTQATPEQWARAMFGDVPTAAERLKIGRANRDRAQPGPDKRPLATSTARLMAPAA